MRFEAEQNTSRVRMVFDSEDEMFLQRLALTDSEIRISRIKSILFDLAHHHGLHSMLIESDRLPEITASYNTAAEHKSEQGQVEDAVVLRGLAALTNHFRTGSDEDIHRVV